MFTAEAMVMATSGVRESPSARSTELSTLYAITTSIPE